MKDFLIVYYYIIFHIIYACVCLWFHTEQFTSYIEPGFYIIRAILNIEKPLRKLPEKCICFYE